MDFVYNFWRQRHQVNNWFGIWLVFSSMCTCVIQLHTWFASFVGTFFETHHFSNPQKNTKIHPPNLFGVFLNGTLEQDFRIHPSAVQADKGFPAFSYTEFLAATFDRSRHCTEPAADLNIWSEMEEGKVQIREKDRCKYDYIDLNVLFILFIIYIYIFVLIMSIYYLDMYIYISTDGRLPIWKSGVFDPGFNNNVLQVCPYYLARWFTVLPSIVVCFNSVV